MFFVVENDSIVMIGVFLSKVFVDWVVLVVMVVSFGVVGFMMKL